MQQQIILATWGQQNKGAKGEIAFAHTAAETLPNKFLSPVYIKFVCC